MDFSISLANPASAWLELPCAGTVDTKQNVMVENVVSEQDAGFVWKSWLDASKQTLNSRKQQNDIRNLQRTDDRCG